MLKLFNDMLSMKFRSLLAFIFTLSILTACKKDLVQNLNPDTTPTPVEPAPVTADQLKDTALEYAREIYLWYDQIPASFNARSYNNLDKLMEGIRQYSTQAGFSNPVDRWSFAIKQTEWDKMSSGIAGDFGINVFFNAPGDLRVRSVERESPAGRAGIRRGWRITKINGNNNITSANADFIVSNVYNSSSTNFSFQKPDNSSIDITLSAATYQERPVFVDTTYTIASKKIGYMVFNSFLGDTAQVQNDFQRIFNRFATQNINDLVVDLRYNGGGYVNLQNVLANYLVKSSAHGNVMMTEQFNKKFSSQYNRTTYFRKRGSLNLNRIYFIVSNNTASASELLINSLKPYMDVRLVGPTKTHGKAVGYFPIDVGDWYIFPVSFRTVNKNGEGNYFDGIALNNQAPDGLDKDWGDINEASLAMALASITGNTSRTMSGSDAYRLQSQVQETNNILSRPFFKGAIGSR